MRSLAIQLALAAQPILIAATLTPQLASASNQLTDRVDNLHRPTGLGRQRAAHYKKAQPRHRETSTAVFENYKATLEQAIKRWNELEGFGAAHSTVIERRAALEYALQIYSRHCDPHDPTLREAQQALSSENPATAKYAKKYVAEKTEANGTALAPVDLFALMGDDFEPDSLIKGQLILVKDGLSRVEEALKGVMNNPDQKGYLSYAPTLRVVDAAFHWAGHLDGVLKSETWRQLDEDDSNRLRAEVDARKEFIRGVIFSSREANEFITGKVSKERQGERDRYVKEGGRLLDSGNAKLATMTEVSRELALLRTGSVSWDLETIPLAFPTDDELDEAQTQSRLSLEQFAGRVAEGLADHASEFNYETARVTNPDALNATHFSPTATAVRIQIRSLPQVIADARGLLSDKVVRQLEQAMLRIQKLDWLHHPDEPVVAEPMDEAIIAEALPAGAAGTAVLYLGHETD